MATYTAGDLIKRALRLLGVLASGEEPEAAEYADSVMAFNQMIDSWTLESLSVYGTMDQVFTWPGGVASRTIGPSGDFVGVTPVLLGEGTYFVWEDVSYPLTIINREQYSSIAIKTISTQIPQFIFPNMVNPGSAVPLMELTLYTVPSEDLEFHIVSVVALVQVADETDTIYVPEGYYEAYVYNLAMRLADEFGVNPSQNVTRTAAKSRVNIKRVNNPNMVMDLPFPLVGNGRYNIVTDNN